MEIGRSRGKEIAEFKSKDTGESDAEDKTGITSGIKKIHESKIKREREVAAGN